MSNYLLALKFEADKDYFNYRHQKSCQTYFCVVSTPKKRLSKAILSSRSEGTMSDVYDLRSSISSFFE